MSFVRRKSNKGSITVEACIALPLFLCFFYLLLFFVKIACVNIVLDHAVKETAQQLAAMSYPVKYINEYIDENVESAKIFQGNYKNEIKKINEMGFNKIKDSLITKLMTGKIEKPDLSKYLNEVKDTVKGDAKEGLKGLIATTILPQYSELKKSGQYCLVSKIFKEYIKNTYVKEEKLSFSLVELPQGLTEYQFKKDKLFYKDSGLEPDIDFNNNDVVIQTDYKFKIPLPFFNNKNIVLRHTAVERAWLLGGNGIYTVDKGKEKLDFFKDDGNENSGSEDDSKDKDREDVRYVYVCKSDTNVYHIYRHCDYIKNSKVTKMTEGEAKKRGKHVHKGCPNRYK